MAKLMFSLLLISSVLTAGATQASATMRISEDRGGQIGHYLRAFTSLRASGENVIIDGNCLSACTILLGIIPRERMCATNRARLGFHAAWLPDDQGRPVTSTSGTRALWRIYPASVKRWITQRGGLSRTMIYMQGRDLYAFVPSCEARNRAQARSNTRYARPSRYERANASSYRR